MIHIVHLYPKTLGLFGDAGNVLALRKRSEWRGLDTRVTEVEPGDAIPAKGDVYVLGSGSRNSVRAVAEDINELADALNSALSRDATILAISAGLHLLGNSISWSEGLTVRCAGILDAVSTPRSSRLVGEFTGVSRGHSVAGFINTGHAFESNLPAHISGIQGLSIVSDGVEAGTIIGTHSHGSYLPMNPVIADEIISRVTGTPLDDSSPNIYRATIAAENSRRAIAARI